MHFGPKKGNPTYSANRLYRWAIILTEYDFEIKFCKNTEFGQRDELSKLTGNKKYL